MTVQAKALWRNGVLATLQQALGADHEIWDGATTDIPLAPTNISAGYIGDAAISTTNLKVVDYPTSVINLPERTVINVYVNDTNLNAKAVADAVYEALNRDHKTRLGN